MTPKQRFEAAMKHQKPDDYVAFMELEYQIHKEYIGKEMVLGFEFDKLSAAEKEKAINKNVEIMIETAEKAGHDAIRNVGGYWEISPGEPAYLWMPGEEAQLAMLKALTKAVGDKYFIIGNGGGTMSIPDGNHLLEFVYNLYENPDEIKANLEKKLTKALEFQKKQMEIGVDCFINCGDVAFNNGPFISPEMCDEFLFPYFNRWVESVKSQGLFTIWHTDGNIMPLMERILESGVTAIQCIDPLGGMDIVPLKKQMKNKLVLIGNVNCTTLQLGPKEKIEKEVKTVVEGCKGEGGFILSGCNAIYKGISAENYQIMVDARYKYGRENHKRQYPVT